MRSALLTVDQRGDGGLSFELETGQHHASHDSPGTGTGAGGPTEDRYDRMASAVPAGLSAALRAWSASGDEPTLLVIDAVGSVDEFAWELLPSIARLENALVVRLTKNATATDSFRDDRQPSILAAGWSIVSEHLWMEGIEREINALASLGRHADAEIVTMLGSTVEELGATYGELLPTVLHLVPAAVDGTALFVDADPDDPWSDAAGLVGRLILASNQRPRFTMLNSCDGIAAAEAISRTTGAPVLSWTGKISDDLAADVATGFYTRLLAGRSLIDAVAGFGDNWDMLGDGVRPVLWITREADLDLVVSDSPATAEQQEPTRRGKPQSRSGARPVSGPALGNDWRIDRYEDKRPPVEVQMELAPAVNPALLVNDEPIVRRLAIRSDLPVDGACLEVSCDTGAQVSSWRQSLNLAADVHVLDHQEITFPALYELIDNSNGRREITISASLDHPDLPAVEVTKSALWMAPDEWMDTEHTWRFISAFVQPQSEGVMEVIDRAASDLRSIGGPGASFSGYQSGAAEDVIMQVRAFYQSLRDGFSISYINPPGGGIYTRDRSAGQRIRNPDVIVERSRGTCHDLALLLASLMEHVGIHPLVILIPGHTFVGFWNDEMAHSEFWRAVRRDPLKRAKMGEQDWLIADVDALRNLHRDGKITLIESTEVTRSNSEFEEACELGREMLFSTGAGFDIAVDVTASRSKVRPL